MNDELRVSGFKNVEFGIANLLAFLFHAVLALVDQSYQRIRRQRGTRKGFFQDILALTKYLLFESWQHLLDFMLDDSPGPPAHNTS